MKTTLGALQRARDAAADSGNWTQVRELDDQIATALYERKPAQPGKPAAPLLSTDEV